MTESSFSWYVVHTHSGFESKVVEGIRERAQRAGCADCFEDFLVPSEKVTKVRKGVKVQEQQFVYPGYVFVSMKLTDLAWHVVRNTPRVAGFLGTHDRPVPVSQREVQRLLTQVQDGSIATRMACQFQTGDHIRVCEGPFNSFGGVIEEVDDTRQRLRVALSIFGRPTPVDLDFSQVEKV